MLDGVVKTVIADSGAQRDHQADKDKTDDTESGAASTLQFKASIARIWRSIKLTP